MPLSGLLNVQKRLYLCDWLLRFSDPVWYISSSCFRFPKYRARSVAMMALRMISSTCSYSLELRVEKMLCPSNWGDTNTHPWAQTHTREQTGGTAPTSRHSWWRETTVRICLQHRRPGFDPLEKEMATHSSELACENSTDRRAWWATVHGVTKSRKRLSD